MSTIRILLLLIIVVLLSGVTTSLKSQSSMQGIITDLTSGQPLEGVNILLESLDVEELTRGAASDRNGYYRITNVQTGEYRLTMSYIGYSTFVDTLNFTEGSQFNINKALEPDDAQLDELIIALEGGVTRREVGHQRLTASDLRRVPTPAGSGDLASYLQALPGVVSVGDRGGQLFIRGGTPSENMVLIDGALIYQPFHIVGFFSPFPEDLVSDVDFYAGGFGPKYNDRISSVMDVRMRSGNRFEYGGSASISPFLAEVMVEGPVIEGTSSIITAVRSSMIESTSETFIGERQPLRFESQYLKYNHVDDNVRCSAFGLHTYDRGSIDFESDESLEWRNLIVAGNCTVLPSESRTLIDFGMGVSNLSNLNRGTQFSEFNSRVTRFFIDLDLTNYIRSTRVEYGFYTVSKWLNFDMSELFQVDQSDDYTMFSLGAYLQTSIPVGNRITFQPGVAVTTVTQYDLSIEPRIQAAWKPFGRDTEEFSAVWGIYRQSLIGVSDIRDANSVFTAWMRAPIGGVQLEATHVLAGWHQQIFPGVDISIEGFYKDLKNMPVTLWSPIARFNTELALANGEVYGWDVHFELNRGRYYGFLGYGYSWTIYETAQDHFGIWFGEPLQRYHPPHDRRHQGNVMGSIDLGSYTFGARWQIGSGLPYTQPIGFDEIHFFDQQMPNVRRNYGTPRVILDRPYEGRMPVYHRLDLSAERTFDLGNAELILQAGAINLYSRTNLFYYDVFTQRRVDQLPFSPFMSLKMRI